VIYISDGFYSRHDNREEYLSGIVARIQKEYHDLPGGGELRVFFDKGAIGGYDRQRRTPMHRLK
jgi:hypothetical protein